MKKYVKMAGILLLCLIVMWIILIIIDCHRLGDVFNGGWKKEPLITIATQEYQDDYGYGAKYIGLGYLVDYYAPNESFGYDVTVKLFYIFPITGFQVL